MSKHYLTTPHPAPLCGLGNEWTTDIEDIARHIEGTLIRRGKHSRVHAVSIDSRTVSNGNIFFAINGKKYASKADSVGVASKWDAHDFILEAYGRGARSFVIDDSQIVEGLRTSRLADSNLILVADSLKALAKLARNRVQSCNTGVIGVTGSTGKTSTTRAIAEILPAQHFLRGRSTIVGLAIDILTRLRSDETNLVVEMQMDGKGQIRSLCEMVTLETAVITSVNSTHIEKLGTVSNVLRAKMEILKGLQSNGTLVLNADDPNLRKWIKPRPSLKVFSYGTSPHCDLFASTIRTLGRFGRCGFNLVYGRKRQSVSLNLVGAQSVYTALATASVCLLHGQDFEEVCDRLKAIRSVPGRMQCLRGRSGSVVVNDTYNASPVSTQAALEYLTGLGFPKRIVIIASMFELGEYSAKAHRSLGLFIADKVDLLITVGQLASLIGEQAEHHGMPPGRIQRLFSVEEAITLASELNLDSNTVVLVKGSAALRMERVTLALVAQPPFSEASIHKGVRPIA